MVPAKRIKNDGLIKRCGCPRAKWLRCLKHPWHMAHMHDGEHYRFPLYRFAKKPSDEPMTKSEAEAYQRDAIQAIHRGELTTDGRRKVEAIAGLTVDEGFDLYVRDWVRVPKRGKRARAAMERLLNTARDIPVPTGTNAQTIRFGDKVLSAVTKADIEAIRTERRRVIKEIRKARKQVEKLREKGSEPPAALLALSASAPNLGDGEHAGEVGIDRLLGRLRHAFNWFISEDKLTTSPFKKGNVVTIRQSGTEKDRTRRLLPGEEDALLQFASPHLHTVIRGMLASCLRSGELLAIQWSDISFEREEITVAAVAEGARKTGEGRIIPMSPEMRGILEERQLAPDGKKHAAKCYVFGTPYGERVGSVRTAWETCVLKAHDHPVERTPTHALTPASQAAIRDIDLHIHDLRREAGSRLLEKGWPLHTIQLMLGHKNIAQTSTYLQADRILMRQAMAREKGAA